MKNTKKYKEINTRRAEEEMKNYDYNNDGIISINEVNMYLSKSKDFSQYMKYDKDHNGIISPDEYLEIMIDELSDLEKEQLDTNKDGIIDLFESFSLTQTYEYQKYYDEYYDYLKNHAIDKNKEYKQLQQDEIERVRGNNNLIG